MQIKHQLLFFFFPSNDLLRYFSKSLGGNMQVTSNPKCWDWKAWEGRGKRYKSLGDSCVCVQHTGMTYILQWRRSTETPVLLPSSMEQPLLLCLHSRLKSSLTCREHYCCVMCSHTLLDCSSELFIKQARLTHFRKHGENHINTPHFKGFQRFQSFWAANSL